MPAAIPLLVSLIPAAIGAGGAIYAAKTGSDASSDALKAQQQATLTGERQDAQATLDARRQEIMKGAPGLQEQTGGSLTPDSFSSMVAALTGNPGSIGLAQSTLFPQNGLTQNSGSSGSPGLSDAMSQLFQPGGSSGGGGSTSLTMPY